LAAHSDWPSVTTLATTRNRSLLEAGTTADSALTGGYPLALLIGAGFVVTALITSFTVLRPTGAMTVEQLPPASVAELAESEAA
jgi:hypothetical protein